MEALFTSEEAWLTDWELGSQAGFYMEPLGQCTTSKVHGLTGMQAQSHFTSADHVSLRAPLNGHGSNHRMLILRAMSWK